MVDISTEGNLVVIRATRRQAKIIVELMNFGLKWLYRLIDIRLAKSRESDTSKWENKVEEAAPIVDRLEDVLGLR